MRAVLHVLHERLKPELSRLGGTQDLLLIYVRMI